MHSEYQKYESLLKRIADINYTIAVLSWDQEVYMPEKGASYRAQQISTLSGIAHDLSVSSELGNILEKLTTDKTLSFKASKNIAESLRLYRKQQKYTTDFVVKMSKTISEAYQAWNKAKVADRFELFAPKLENLVVLKREECKFLGYEDHPYDALLDEYEPNLTVAQLQLIFSRIKEDLVPLVQKIAKQPQNEDNFLYKKYETQKQWNFGIELLKQMGYNFNAGRQDISIHPFTTNFNALDVRITTRINENDLSEMIWSCIHEGGHALYEQGLNPDDYGLPTGETISLGIHESQSRLWENNVGRALPYWKVNFPILQEKFPGQLGNISLDTFYKGINVVKPSLIRTSADELTYHLHILIRFEIEKALIGGEIEVNDLPSVWNRKYKAYLGVNVPSDAKGVLQDIHWSHGSFGYFPTYSLGSFYAAQFYAQAKNDISDLEIFIEKGDMKPLLSWLRENIHRYGKLYMTEELCTRVTGEKLNPDYFMAYSKQKYSYLYKIS